MFDPEGYLILGWEFVYFAMSLLLFIYVPFSVSFQSEQSFMAHNFLWGILMTILCIDILKTCNTAIYVKGELIREHLAILGEYIKSMELILDLITLAGTLGYFDFAYSRSLFLLRIIYKPALLEKFKDSLCLSEKSIATIDLLKLFATVLYLCHVVACAWFKLGQI